MTRHRDIETHLAPAPAQVRRRMIENRSALEPGAAAVVGRFYAALSARREPPDAPSAAPFRAAAASESTLATLLRALATYAPELSTAAGRALRHDHYRKRGGCLPRNGMSEPRRNAAADIGSWPAAWQDFHPALDAARVRDSTKRRYRASISRCARIVAAGRAGADLTFYEAWRLATALREDGVAPISIAGYLDGLVALGRHGGVSSSGLDGVRHLRDHLRDEARLGGKAKYARLAGIMDQGGFEYIAGRVGAMRDELAKLPDHVARAECLRQRIALCALHMNKPGRTGDVSRWTIGQDLTRTVDGGWRLQWRQEKTGRTTEAGELWPEVGEALDELILGGRPSRFIHLRYGELQGANWLTLGNEVRDARWPSAQIKAAIGIPSHDLRTLSADYLRRHDPAKAADVIATHLGHATKAAGNAYRAEAEGDAAAADWARMRRTIATHGRNGGRCRTG